MDVPKMPISDQVQDRVSNVTVPIITGCWRCINGPASQRRCRPLNTRFVTVEMTQIEESLRDLEITVAKLRKVIDRYVRAGDAARRAFDGGESPPSLLESRSDETVR